MEVGLGSVVASVVINGRITSELGSDIKIVVVVNLRMDRLPEVLVALRVLIQVEYLIPSGMGLVLAPASKQKRIKCFMK